MPPFLPPTAPKCRLFRPADPALRPENPARSPRYSPAGARFSRFLPGSSPRMPPETRPLCAVSRQARPLSSPVARHYPGVRPWFAPAPPPNAAFRRPARHSRPSWGCAAARSPAPLGLQPIPAFLLRRTKVCGPRGASIPGSDPKETAAPSRVKFREIGGPGYQAQKQEKRTSSEVRKKRTSARYEQMSTQYRFTGTSIYLLFSSSTKCCQSKPAISR